MRDRFGLLGTLIDIEDIEDIGDTILSQRTAIGGVVVAGVLDGGTEGGIDIEPPVILQLKSLIYRREEVGVGLALASLQLAIVAILADIMGLLGRRVALVRRLDERTIPPDTTGDVPEVRLGPLHNVVLGI